MKRKRRNIYEVRDRQGIKYFERKPEFVPMHDIFVGDQIYAITNRHRIVRRFTAKVRQISAGLPSTIRVRP